MAAVIAGVLALLTTGMLVWFALYNVDFASGLTGGLPGVTLVNLLGGVIGAGLLLGTAGFTFARRIFGAWALCALCMFYVAGMLLAAPLMWGTPIGAQVAWIFSFDDSDSVAIALAIVFAVLTAVTAAIAAIIGTVKSYGPTAATPPCP